MISIVVYFHTSYGPLFSSEISLEKIEKRICAFMCFNQKREVVQEDQRDLEIF